MKLYSKTAIIPGGGKGFVFTGEIDGPGSTFPGAYEVDFATSVGALAHGFTRSEIRPDAVTEDAQLTLGEPITLPAAAAVLQLDLLSLRPDGDFQPRASGNNEGVSAIALRTTGSPGAVLALPFLQTLRDPRSATITTLNPSPSASLQLCPEMSVDFTVRAGVSVFLTGFIQLFLPPGSAVELALFFKQAGALIYSEISSWPRRRAENGAGNSDQIVVPVPLGDLISGASISASGLATVQLHWRTLSGSPSAIGVLRSLSASATG